MAEGAKKRPSRGKLRLETAGLTGDEVGIVLRFNRKPSNIEKEGIVSVVERNLG